jgi:hypothetical protein
LIIFVVFTVFLLLIFVELIIQIFLLFTQNFVFFIIIFLFLSSNFCSWDGSLLLLDRLGWLGLLLG